MDDIVIAAAARTPVGSFMGGLATLAAHELGTVALKAAMARARLSADEVDEVILGQVLTAAAGQNPARQAAMAAGVPADRTAFGVNQVCGSGLRAVALAAQQIMTGQSRIVAAGGQESMSQAPHAVQMRPGLKMGQATLVDTMLSDGLTDAFDRQAMGMTAETVADTFSIGRAAQDAYALRSQQRAQAARAAGRFDDEIAPVGVPGPKGETVVARDESIRDGVTAEGLARLKPVFREGGSVTPGNSSGINDGAAALILMTGTEAARRGIAPLARIASFATAGVEPRLMGTGPIPASRRALERAGWRIADLDLIEANEAFAAQAICVSRTLELDEDRLNVSGGAVALGHPIGASGARVLTTLLYEMTRRDVRRGLATLCVGGGMGVAMCLER